MVHKEICPHSRCPIYEKWAERNSNEDLAVIKFVLGYKCLALDESQTYELYGEELVCSHITLLNKLKGLTDKI